MRIKNKALVIFTVCLALISNVEARKEFSGDWITDISSGIGEAYVTNSSNSLFGLLCMEQCVWYVDFQKKCDDGDKYTALISSDIGATSVDMKCIHLGKRPLMTLNDFDTIQRITLQAKSIGFAIALPDSKFHVSRFSLNGAGDAQLKVVNSLVKSKKSNDYRDSRM